MHTRSRVVRREGEKKAAQEFADDQKEEIRRKSQGHNPNPRNLLLNNDLNRIPMKLCALIREAKGDGGWPIGAEPVVSNSDGSDLETQVACEME